MSLLVIGATGTLGRQVVRHALDQGLKVRCLVRIPKKASFLREWGAELVQGSLIKPETLPEAFEGMTQVIDAATTRATDSLRIKAVDWDGKLSLIKAAEQAKIEKFVFFSIMNAELYPKVPLMEIKHCTEKFIQKTDLNYTILRPCGFMQGLIGQYAIPVLENEAIWVTGESTPVAYMNTQDIARFAVRSLSVPETDRQTFGIAGLRTWSPSEIVRQCERASGRTARTANMPIGIMRAFRNTMLSFEWSWNISERMAFAEVLASGTPLTADMTETCKIFGIDPDSITTLESYFQEYFSRILLKLKELDYKEPKMKTPF